jgi:hypothetical protein
MQNDRAGTSVWLSERIGSRMCEALALMIDAFHYAEDLRVTPWNFSVPIAELRNVGLSDNDLRWLVGTGYFEHVVEVTERGDELRSFRPGLGAMFSERASFLLTERGCAYARAVLLAEEGRSQRLDGEESPTLHFHDHAGRMSAATGLTVAITFPTWDRDRQELRWGSLVVKQFKVPSPNQETILATFEEEHWPPRIDDPLPPQLDQDPKRRLHDTINALNRNQKNALIRFLGDGSGQGVRWEPSGREAGGNGTGSCGRSADH